MSEVTMTPQERKEELINKLQASIEFDLTTNMTTKRTTAKCAPSFGWSVEEYLFMPIVAQRLRAKGYGASSQVNWEVTDWVFTV